MVNRWRILFFPENFVPIQINQAAHQNPETNRDDNPPGSVDIEGDDDQTEQRDILQDDVWHVRAGFCPEIDLEHAVE